MRGSKISDETKSKLDEMFLPELHQAWWAEELARLNDMESAAKDPKELQAIESRIREHYRLEHDVEITSKRLQLFPR